LSAVGYEKQKCRINEGIIDNICSESSCRWQITEEVTRTTALHDGLWYGNVAYTVYRVQTFENTSHPTKILGIQHCAPGVCTFDSRHPSRAFQQGIPKGICDVHASLISPSRPSWLIHIPCRPCNKTKKKKSPYKQNKRKHRSKIKLNKRTNRTAVCIEGGGR